MWYNPLTLKLIPTSDGDSFKNMPSGSTGLPLPGHPGAFGFVRRHHTHEGVDLYCPNGSPVYAVERGMVIHICDFTGPKVNSPWWNDTQAVMVEGDTGVVIYGEISPIPLTCVGTVINKGDLIGHVKQVLIKDKGRPMSMLHLELHAKGSPLEVEWVDRHPDGLLDPTPFLLAIGDT